MSYKKILSGNYFLQKGEKIKNSQNIIISTMGLLANQTEVKKKSMHLGKVFGTCQ